MIYEEYEGFNEGNVTVYGELDKKYIISYQKAYKERIEYFKQHYACGQCGNILRKHRAETGGFFGLKHCNCVEKVAKTPKEKVANKKEVKLSIEPLSLF
jgi:ribosomal protein L37AE/L43A